jgi:dCTP deaminase
MIHEAMRRGEIVIDPFDPKALGSNSYDVHLGNELLVYTAAWPGGYGSGDRLLNVKKDNPAESFWIQPAGHILKPGILYLASTVEYTETHKHVPFLDGKSSVGRLGITIHCTAGRGDVGFCNHWTMEIHVVQPVKIYAGMPIGQLTYFETGEVETPYSKKSGAKYTERSRSPMTSQMWRNFK